MYAALIYEYLVVPCPCFVEHWRSCCLFVYVSQGMEASNDWMLGIVFILQKPSLRHNRELNLHSEDIAHMWMWYIFWGCT